jgi:regulator of sigma E protease
MPQLVNKQFTVKSDTTISAQELFAGYVEPGSPAAKEGLRSGDRIVGAWSKQSPCNVPALGVKDSLICAMNIEVKPDIPLKTADDLLHFTKSHAGQTVHLAVYRGGDTYALDTTLRSESAVAASLKTSQPKGYLGVEPAGYTLQRSTWSAPIVAGGLMGQFTALTFQGLGKALAGLGGIIAGGVSGNHVARENAQTEASNQVSGPVGIFFILKSGSTLGYQYMLFIIAIISLTLAIMNILPIPALDGGRLWLTLITRGIKRPLQPKTEEIINATGFFVLIGLIILISVVDVHRFF